MHVQMEATQCFHSLIIILIIIIIISFIFSLTRVAGFGQSKSQSFDHRAFRLGPSGTKPANTDRREERETNESEMI